MVRSRRAAAGWTAGLALVLAASLALVSARVPTPPDVTLPHRLTDEEFWQLSTELSEPDGYFRSENLVSNEHTFQYVIPALDSGASGPAACTSASRPIRTSPTWWRPRRAWRSSSTSGAAICSST